MGQDTLATSIGTRPNNAKMKISLPKESGAGKLLLFFPTGILGVLASPLFDKEAIGRRPSEYVAEGAPYVGYRNVAQYG